MTSALAQLMDAAMPRLGLNDDSKQCIMSFNP
jgi:hypothetical protein